LNAATSWRVSAHRRWERAALKMGFSAVQEHGRWRCVSWKPTSRKTAAAANFQKIHGGRRNLLNKFLESLTLIDNHGRVRRDVLDATRWNYSRRYAGVRDAGDSRSGQTRDAPSPSRRCGTHAGQQSRASRTSGRGQKPAKEDALLAIRCKWGGSCIRKTECTAGVMRNGIQNVRTAGLARPSGRRPCKRMVKRAAVRPHTLMKSLRAMDKVLDCGPAGPSGSCFMGLLPC